MMMIGMCSKKKILIEYVIICEGVKRLFIILVCAQPFGVFI